MNLRWENSFPQHLHAIKSYYSQQYTVKNVLHKEDVGVVTRPTAANGIATKVAAE